MRVLLVINATLSDRTEQAISAGRSPRKDYLELQRALGADILDLGTLRHRRLVNLAARILGTSIAQALLAWTSAARYDAVFLDRETTGFVLAALLKLRRQRPRVSMIAHLLSPPKKQVLFRALRLQHAIDCVVVHSSRQERLAVERLQLRPDQVALVPYQADDQFWRPSNMPAKNLISSVGLEYRDYDTLVEAVKGLDVDLTIAAASHWSRHQHHIGMPPRVRVESFGYEALRDLYAESRFVVVPLHDVNNQAGITVILEAMAMAKPVIVSHTRGQADVVRDRRSQNRSDPERTSQPNWVKKLGVTDAVADGQTGLYVMPKDAAELRRAIIFLLQHPEQARQMGANGRRVVESAMSLDLFTMRLAGLISGQVTESDGVQSILESSNSVACAPHPSIVIPASD